MVERQLCKLDVAGSNPTTSTSWEARPRLKPFFTPRLLFFDNCIATDETATNADAGRTVPVKRTRAHDGCLGIVRRRRTRQAAISSGERQTRFDPEISEWSNPPGPNTPVPAGQSIARRRDTRGSETSHYPQEKRTTVIPQVVASERGTAQTGGPAPRGCGTSTWHGER